MSCTRVTAVLLLSFSAFLSLGHSPCLAEEEPTWAAQIRASLFAEEWPTDEGVLRGFTFNIEDYAPLSEHEVASDNESFDMVQVTDNPIGAVWHGETTPYFFIVRRQCRLQLDTTSYIDLQIEVCPSVASAHRRVLTQYVSMSQLPIVALSSRYQVDIGDVCILRDAQPDDEDWEITSSKSLFFFRNNVYVDLTATGSDVDIIALAALMDAHIQSELSQSNGVPTIPELSLSLSSNTVHLKTFRPALGFVTFTHEASWDGQDDEVRVRGFSTKKTQNYRSTDDPDDEYQMEPDPETPITYTRASLRFSLAPSFRIEQLTNGMHGNYHVGLVAWGPNLLPTSAYSSLAVDASTD